MQRNTRNYKDDKETHRNTKKYMEVQNARKNKDMRRKSDGKKGTHKSTKQKARILKDI